ncbi:glycosyltransferase family 2 protein [Paenibacillus filicis]|uniref:Glycosyltransferase family 2 protein n=1 Tax=Paenibacillus gyeongsangnamensis TaxID=3388067 RepID=A0ABT4QHY6_9BACL|nr:glycosyltransferase family 2 protein [Paenibacillus filicis]MCZ8516495.1 glycosyltransferase family 2 protein [Paenibacillus filicis]
MELSIIIPTFNERENVRKITNRIMDVLRPIGCSYEIFFVDDSRDDTPTVLEELSKNHHEVKYLHRQNGRGLGTAVVEGFKRTQGNFIIVMDADLQHPPELLPLIYRRLLQGIEVLIPSRFVEGGSDGGLNWFRKLVSWTARTIGRISIKRMRDISDCTGGYFGLHRSVIEGVTLDPVGWKILMEVLVKGKYQTVHEIPYSFEARDAGTSKMSTIEQWNYLKHIFKLVWSSPDDRRFYLFCMVGALGVLVNLMVLKLLLIIFLIHSLAASIGASCVAMLHNFLWNDNFTWKEKKQPIMWRRVLRLPQFIVISGVGIGITAAFAWLASWIGINIFLGQLAGIIVATSWNYLANNKWTWEASKSNRKAKITVTQEV